MNNMLRVPVILEILTTLMIINMIVTRPLRKAVEAESFKKHGDVFQMD